MLLRKRHSQHLKLRNCSLPHQSEKDRFSPRFERETRRVRVSQAVAEDTLVASAASLELLERGHKPHSFRFANAAKDAVPCVPAASGAT